MTCLRAARAQGVVPSSEAGLWGGLVPLSLLQQALVHKHDQVSMSETSGVYLLYSLCFHIFSVISWISTVFMCHQILPPR